MANFKSLNCTVILNNLCENEIINIPEYVEKLHFFRKYCMGKGTYITEISYV